MDHFDGGAIDDQGSAECQSLEDYYGRLQKHVMLPDPSSSVWDFEYQFCDIQAGENIVAGKEAYRPFDSIPSSSIHNGVTNKDINEMIKNKHKNDAEPSSYKRRRIHAMPPLMLNSSFQVSAISGKPVVRKIRIRTKGGGTITMSRIIG